MLHILHSNRQRNSYFDAIICGHCTIKLFLCLFVGIHFRIIIGTTPSWHWCLNLHTEQFEALKKNSVQPLSQYTTCCQSQNMNVNNRCSPELTAIGKHSLIFFDILFFTPSSPKISTQNLSSFAHNLQISLMLADSIPHNITFLVSSQLRRSYSIPFHTT